MVIRNLPGLACALVFAIALSGCGGGGGGGGGSTASGGKQINIAQDCSQLQWTSTSADPMSTVLVKGVDKKLRGMLTDPRTDAYARIEANGKTLGAMPVRWSSAYASSSLQVGVPAYPDKPYQGGDVEVTLVFGQGECPSQTLTVSALNAPAKPNQVISDSVNALQSLLMKRARTYGYQSFSDLTAKRDRMRDQGEGSSMPEVLLVMAADGLEKLKQQTASGKLSADSAKFMATVLHSVGPKGFVSGLQGLNSAFGGSLPTVDPDQDIPPATAINPDTGNYVRAESTSSGGAGACAAVLMGKPEPISGPGQLSTYMIQQHDAYAKANGASGTALDLVGLGLPVAGLVSGPGEAAAVAISLEIYVYQFVQALTINTLPSHFDRVDLRLDPGATFPEDYLEVSGNSTPRWVEADATVSSNGMNLSSKALGAVLQVFGGADYASSRGVETEFAEDVVEALKDIRLYDVQKYVNQLLSQQGGVSCLKVEPWSWSGIDISSGLYTTAQYYGSNISLRSAGADVNKQTMKPVQTGTGALDIETIPAMFGGHRGIADQEVEVEKIELLPDPNPYWVSTPGETKTFKIHIAPADAANPGKTLTDRIMTGGGHAYRPAYNASGGYHTVKVDTPTDTSKYPVKVRVSRTTSIPDEQGRSVRDAFIEIRNDQAVDLTPDKRCIGRGETLQLSAKVHGVSGLNSGDVAWTLNKGSGSVQPGSISGTTETATYTAPAGGTDAFVQAAYTNAKGKTVTDVSHVAVGSCDTNVYIGGFHKAQVDAGSDRSEYNSKRDALKLPLPPPLGKPVNPANKWQGRTEQFYSNNSASDSVKTTCSSTQPDSSSPTGVICSTFDYKPLRGYESGNAKIGADADGNVTFTLSDQGSVHCYATDDRYARPDDPECSTSEARDVWQIRYDFDIDAASKPKRKVTLKLSCYEREDDFSLASVYFFAGRWQAGAAAGHWMPLAITTSTYNQYQSELGQGIYDPSDLKTRWDLTDGVSPCATGEPITITRTLDAPPPDAAGTTHQASLVFSVGAYGGVMPTYNKDQLHDLYQSGNIGSVQPPQDVPGSWSGSVYIQGTISVEAVQ